MRDVKEVFSALKENLDQMMANLQDGVMLFTSDFNAVLVSASAERFVGKPRAEILGHHPAEIFTRESRLGRMLLEGFEARTPFGMEEIEDEQGRHNKRGEGVEDKDLVPPARLKGERQRTQSENRREQQGDRQSAETQEELRFAACTHTVISVSSK